MLISGLFSVVIYQTLTFELNRIERAQRFRVQNPELFPWHRPGRLMLIDPEVIQETKNRIKLRLLLTNLGILALAGGAGYFLAGRTLRPIKDMVDEQNRFISDASHELRTPLASLRSEIEVSLRDKKLKLHDAKALLVSNLEEVDHLQALSDSLMALSRYQKPNDTTFVQVSLSDIFEEAKRRVHGLAKQKQITVSIISTNIMIEVDKPSLTELFVILLDNAIKYSPEGTTVSVSTSRTDHTVKITVRDEGIGIAKEDLPYVFDRFYRADTSRTKNKTDGHGLGLSIAKKIVEKHHGNIRAEGAKGQGTTFTLQLPQKQSRRFM